MGTELAGGNGVPLGPPSLLCVLLVLLFAYWSLAPHNVHLDKIPLPLVVSEKNTVFTYQIDKNYNV